MPAEEAPTWGFRSRLPWPAARGERLWTQVMSAKGLSQYDVELCEPSAGHIALVLVKKQISTAAPGTPGPAPSTGGGGSPPLGRRGSTPLATAAAHMGAAVTPRVVFVLDAIPPPRNATSPAKVQQKQGVDRSHLSLRSLSPASTGSSTVSSNGGALSDSTQLQQQDVDELDLIEELFSAAKVGKDGAILAKSPLLCARFDCKVVAIKFMRGHSSSTSLSSSQRSGSNSNNSSSSTVSTTLRCVVAREDGMALLWEWGGDLHQWTFLNQFCFLENPNLKWTRPVVAFTATEMAWHGETTEFAWWSMESKAEPKLCLRKIQYAQEQSTFRTEITIGNAFALTCSQVSELKSSKLGLWIITKAMGVHFRSAESLRMASLSWPAVLGGGTSDDGGDEAIKAATADPATELLTCLHNVTGELLVLVRGSGAVHLVSSKDSKHPQQQQQGIKAKCLTVLGSWSSIMARDAVSIAAHRHLLFVMTSETILAFSYLTGEQLASVALPPLSSPQDFHPKSKAAVHSQPPALWTITGGASSVGLWSSSGFWFIQTPSAKTLGSSLNPLLSSSNSQRLTQQQGNTGNPRAAFESLAKYGESLKFETALQALEILEKVSKSIDACDAQVWSSLFQSLSSPALLLAVFADQNVPEALVDELARIVASLHQIAHEITVGGRFASSWEKGVDASTKSADQYSAAQKLTPANIEALRHLSNWILLAKRKITRLQTSAYFKGRHHMRPRAVSALTTVASDDSGAPFSTFSPLEGYDDDPDGANFRLSRKLRPMSSLRFASGSCALHHGKQWLVQLESFLLDGVAFKKTVSEGPVSNNNNINEAVPSHLLFHEERQLEDYRNSNSSFSKHMYVESMSRLYLLHEPAALLPFVQCVSEFCPRLFSLSGTMRVSRSHAERALTLFPPMQFFVERFIREQLQLKQQQQLQPLKESQKKKQRHKELGVALAKDSLLAYTALLCRCEYYLEACQGLLQCDLYEHCRESLLINLLKDQVGGFDETQTQQETEQLNAVYFALLEYCVKHRDVQELQLLLELKPGHVSVLHVLRALRNHLPQKVVKKSESESEGGGAQQQVTVGKLRPVLLALLKQQRAAAVQVA